MKVLFVLRRLPRLMTTVAVLTGALLCFATNALAINERPSTCQELFNPSHSVKGIGFLYFHDPLTHSEAAQMADAIHEINAMVPSTLQAPKKVTVLSAYRFREGDRPPSAVGDSAIIVPYVPNSPDGHTKHPRYSIATLAHEYGHLIFLNNFVRYSSFGRKLDQLATQIETAMKSNPSPSEEEKEAIQQMVTQARAMYALVAPYNELFADLTAILHFKDGQAMYKSFKYTGEQFPVPGVTIASILRRFRERLENFKFRDFTHRVPVEGWTLGEDPHYTLTPVRSFLWEEYLKRPMWMNKPGEILDAVFFAICAEIDKRQNGITVDSPETLSRDLIARIQERLGS